MEPNMRLALALAVFAGGILVQDAPADADRKNTRALPHKYKSVPPRYSRKSVECEGARHADPGGYYARFPCWAREAFGRGPQISN
jgi:hypothetical protein